MLQMSSLGSRIRELRLKKGMTQAQLAEGLCTPSMISQIESGRARPSYEILSNIASRLEIPLEVLVAKVEWNMQHLSMYKMSRAMMGARDYLVAVELLSELLEVHDPSISVLDVNCDLAECFINQGNLEEAYSLLHDVLEQAIKEQISYLVVSALRNLGQIEYQLERFSFALRHWKRALEEGVNDPLLLAPLLVQIGSCCERLGLFEESHEYLQRAIHEFEKSSEARKAAEVYVSLSAFYQSVEDYRRAESYAERAAGLYEGLELATVVKRLFEEIQGGVSNE